MWAQARRQAKRSASRSMVYPIIDRVADCGMTGSQSDSMWRPFLHHESGGSLAVVSCVRSYAPAIELVEMSRSRFTVRE
jgi:hypothetical protein